jgi:hypothetical protein
MVSKTFIGHHGTDLELAELICKNDLKFAKSDTGADWLGTGAYFWVDNLDRAIRWIKGRRRVKKKAVIQAVIKAKNLLDVNLTEHQTLLRESHRRIEGETKRYGYIKLSNIVNADGDIVERRLDCAVIDGVNKHFKGLGLPEFDVCVGAFENGEPVFPGAAILDKSHVQLCVIDPLCIKKPTIAWRYP